MNVSREDILQVFLVEATEQLDAIEESLLALEHSPDDDELLNLTFRAAHSLKGNASVVNLTSLEEVTHTFEDALERLKARTIPVTKPLVGLLLRVVDGLRRSVPRAVEGVEDPLPEHAELRSWLAAAAEESAKGSTPAAASDPYREAHLAAGVRTLRVEIGKLDRMLDLVGEITIARGKLASLLSPGGEEARSEELKHAHHEADHLYLELQEQLMRARMVRIGPTLLRYLRLVRDLSIACGKRARLVLEGEDVEVDTSVVEELRDPLTHMIRNAIDHGIERPEVRREKGKPEEGTLLLKAYHDAGNIVLRLSDDGAGLDRRRIVQRARSLGLLESEDVDDQELFNLIFEPGFSTATDTTEVSGRGVGMDVVRRNVELMRGSVAVDSVAGRSTTIEIRLPLTLAIIEGFSVMVGAESYVLPLESVVECVDLPEEEREKDLAAGIVELRGQPLPYVRLAHLFAVERDPRAREGLVVLQHEGTRAGLAVDRLRGAGQAVIKPLANLVDHAATVTGCTVLGDGRVALILDVPAILRAAEVGTEPGSRGGRHGSTTSPGFA